MEVSEQAGEESEQHVGVVQESIVGRKRPVEKYGDTSSDSHSLVDEESDEGPAPKKERMF